MNPQSKLAITIAVAVAQNFEGAQKATTIATAFVPYSLQC